MISFFTTVFYQPIYNVFVLLINLFPWADAGIIIILLTIIVRLILFPLSQKSIRTQLKMKEIGPELEAIKLKYKDDKQEQAKKTMEFYKQKGINPFSGFFALLIQFPIIIALYQIFYSGTNISKIDVNLLYSFIHLPGHAVSMVFLGFISLVSKNLIFAILAAVTQFIQAQIITPKQAPAVAGQKSLGSDLARSMTFQSKYVFPIIIFFIAYAVSAAVSLYWIVSNVFSIFQELYVRRQYKKETAAKAV